MLPWSQGKKKKMRNFFIIFWHNTSMEVCLWSRTGIDKGKRPAWMWGLCGISTDFREGFIHQCGKLPLPLRNYVQQKNYTAHVSTNNTNEL